MHVKSLYELCLTETVEQYKALSSRNCQQPPNKDLRNMPDHVLFDVYHTMHKEGQFKLLLPEFRDWELFARMLTVKQRRVELFRIFQGLINITLLRSHDDVDYANDVVLDYVKCVQKHTGSVDQMIEMGFTFVIFLTEGSWFKTAHDLLGHIQTFIRQWETTNTWRRKLFFLECLQRRLFVEASYALFDNADQTLTSTNVLLQAIEMEAVETNRTLPNLASLYATYTHLFTQRSEYDEAYKWGIKAIALLNVEVSKSTCLFVLRILAKVCVMKRRYSEGNFLIQQALMLAKELYQRDLHPNLADTLMVYGFFLLNYDNINESVQVYNKALNVRVAVFGKNNIHVGLACEELAYAHYANEYSTGEFNTALTLANKAASILENLLPQDHLLLACAKRVRGLILEEIALGINEPVLRNQRDKLLMEAELLHKSALTLTILTFGQNNVQAAKHYGNLGRVYQSLGDYKEAERMHLLALRIKEELLGMFDFEVALSLNNLASLYNFNMNRFKDAERYYLRSIEIGVSLFGEAYSGLLYDYRGLIKVYTELNDTILADKYRDILHKWQQMRQAAPVTIEHYDSLLSIPNIVRLFLNWDHDNIDAIARSCRELAH